MKAFDFDSAKIKHSLWSSRLRSFIYGDMALENELNKNEHECDLGKWIDTNTVTLQKSSVFKKLQEIHTNIHEHTQKIIALSKQEKDFVILLENYKDYEVEMKQLLALLDEMKKEWV